MMDSAVLELRKHILMECIQQNINDNDFVTMLLDYLGLGEEE